MPRITIIVPVYMVENYIQKCLESIFEQQVELSFFEVLVVNDGTNDNSMQIVHKFAEKYSNLLVIEQENQGLSVARNSGLDRAKGEYIWFVDSDDTILPDALSYIASEINQNDKIDVFATVLQTCREDNGKMDLEYKPNLSVTSGKDYMFKNNNANCAACPRYIFKKKFLIENELRFMPGVFHEDGEFCFRMLYLADSLLILPRPIYCYLLRSSGSITSSRTMKMNYDLIRIYEALEKFAAQNQNSSDYWLFKAKIFTCLKDTICFSRNEIFTNDFSEFYDQNKKLITNKAREIALRPNQVGCMNFFMGMQYWIIPKLEIQIKSFLKNKIYKKI
ncbi:glycosyltransferase [Aquirufa sp. 5-AUSEE-100C1]